MSEAVVRLYSEIWGGDSQKLVARLNDAAVPRSPDDLYEIPGRLGVGPDSTVLDIGCRDASDAVEISRRLGCAAIGIDPVPLHIELAGKMIADCEAASRVSARPGCMEAIPLADGSVDFVWARDMISHVDLPKGLAECRRVLRPGGSIMVYQAFATELLAPIEAAPMCRALAIVPDNMRASFFEATAISAGFEITRRDTIGSEWRESALLQANGSRELSDALIRVSRLLRRKVPLSDEFGADAVETAYWGDLWCLYILMGKLRPMVYLLTRPPQPEQRSKEHDPGTSPQDGW